MQSVTQLLLMKSSVSISVYKCAFESSDLCGFKQDEDNILHWWWRGGEEDTLLQDHTTMTDTGTIQFFFVQVIHSEDGYFFISETMTNLR